MHPTLKAILLWILAFILTIAMAVYQRVTGPTYPIDGEYTAAGETYEYTLHRTHELVATGEHGTDHVVRIPVPDTSATATLYYRKLGVDEPFTPVPMQHEDGHLIAPLPAQPPAGKLVYHVEIDHGGEHFAIPSDDETVTIRYKGFVSPYILTPHIFAMFFALFLSWRALLAVFFRERYTVYAWLTLILFFIGGLVLGPLVQKAAFGDYWTGWPLGSDVTDNKVALAFIAWAVAVWRIHASNLKKARIWVVIACLVMFGMYLIPHSLGGSTFNYETGGVETGL